jgi:hypothetical protein
MATLLDLEFRVTRPGPADRPAVEHAGPSRYRLHPGRDGAYRLPDVVVRTRPGVWVVDLVHLDIDTPGLGGELAQKLKANWVPREATPQSVAGESVLAQGVEVPMSLVLRGTGLRAPGGVPSVRVVWTPYAVDPGNPRTATPTPPVEMILEFAAPGAPRGTSGPGSGLVTHRTGADPINGWAAIDLGTSSSTVTMCRAKPGSLPGMDRGQEHALALALADLLAGLTGEVATAWAGVATTLPGIDATARANLPARLRERSDSDLVQRVVAAVELLCRDDPAVADELRGGLHAAYRTAFRTPPLQTYALESHRFAATGETSVDSAATVVSTTTPPLLYLGERPGYFDNAEDGVAYPVIRDLKRRFARRRESPLPQLAAMTESGEGVAVERIVAAAYVFLADSAERVVGAERAERVAGAGTPEFRTVVATYPTTTTPAARTSLATLLRDQAGFVEVVTDYDEGVAAGLYFLMQDIGKDQATGAEMFRARARAVRGAEDVWEQTVVVVDIGGGTTDVAVIRYTMSDETPADPDVLGRAYRIRPEVVGSTGHPLLGGHFLTLRVLYWLKAAIIDAILAQSNPELDKFRREVGEIPLGGFEAAVVEGSTSTAPVPRTQRDLLRRLMPTSWSADDPVTHQAGFDRFWRQSEAIKIALSTADAKPYRLEAAELRDLLDPLRPRESGAFQHLWNGDVCRIDDDVVVELRPDDFVRIVQPAVDIAAEHAASLVQKVIMNGRASGLDRILLSGQTSLMPLVAERVGATLAGIRMPDEDTRTYRMPEPEVERAFAKEAASIGACWARANVEFGQRDADNKAVRRGRTELMIRVDNLNTALPSDFEIRKFGLNETLFKLGEPFRELDATGRRGVRTPDFDRVQGTHQIFRLLGHDHRVPWSSFPFSMLTETAANGQERKPGACFDDGGTMRVMVELDQDCAPTLHLCDRGAPHYVLAGVSAVVPGLGPGTCGFTSVPSVAVRTGRGTATDPLRDVTLVEGGDADPAALDTFFGVPVRPVDDVDAEPIGGHVLRSLPPVSAESGTYTFVITVDGVAHESDPVAVPGDRRTGEYKAVLLRTCELRLFRGELPFLTAHNLDDLETRPGAVLSRSVGGGEPDEEPEWDPFTGEH